VEPLHALAIATAVYAALLAATYAVMVLKSPQPYRRPRAGEVAALLLILAVFFALGYLLLVGLG
jgi:hypothetical protein